jgi:dienelactone hydrolase
MLRPVAAASPWRWVCCAAAMAVVVASVRFEAEAVVQSSASPEVLDVPSGALTLRAQMWRPSGTGLVGHSFGGSLSVLMAAGNPEIRAAVIFGGAAGSWNQSAALRARLLAAIERISAPILFIHAENDDATAPGRALAGEMARLKKPHGLKIYPPFRADPRAGHNLVFRSLRTWESDVFGFLDAHLRP